jgi:PTS system galactitol-specific IIB component
MGKPIKKIACVCGAAVASSTSAKYAIEEYLAEHGVKGIDVQCYKIGDFDAFADTVDLIVAMSKIYKKTDTPIVNGLCYLTSIGVDERNSEILEMILKSREGA